MCAPMLVFAVIAIVAGASVAALSATLERDIATAQRLLEA